MNEARSTKQIRISNFVLRNSGFSLIELMLTMVFVMLGAQMIQGTMLRAADVYGRYTDTLKVILWSQEQTERVHESLLKDELESKSGVLEAPNKTFEWRQNVTPMDGPNLYKIDLSLSWAESGKPIHFQKSLYAYKKDLL
jgi:hypothetical protein